MDKKYEAQMLKYQEQILQFGLNIKKLRVKKGLTQAEAATLCSLDVRTIQRVENGQMAIKLPIVFIFAEAFGVAVTTLFKNIDV